MAAWQPRAHDLEHALREVERTRRLVRDAFGDEIAGRLNDPADGRRVARLLGFGVPADDDLAGLVDAVARFPEGDTLARELLELRGVARRPRAA